MKKKWVKDMNRLFFFQIRSTNEHQLHEKLFMENMSKSEPLCTVGRNVNQHSCYENYLEYIGNTMLYLEVPQNLKVKLSYDPLIPLLGLHPKLSEIGNQKGYAHSRDVTFHAKLSPSVMCSYLRPHGLQPANLFYPWDFPSKNTKVSCHFLLQGIFLTQGSKLPLLPLLHCRFFTNDPSKVQKISIY